MDTEKFRSPTRIAYCEVCEADAGPILEYHHVIPVQHSGEHSAKNLVLVCPNCHALVSRDQCRWAANGRHELFSKAVGRRIALLCAIQHAPTELMFGWSDEWAWLEELSGLSYHDLPGRAVWGNRNRREWSEGTV